MNCYGKARCRCATQNPCRTWRDQFDRPDSSAIGADYTEGAGDWEIADEALTISSPSNGDYVKADVADPLIEYYAVTGVLRSTANGDQLGLLLMHEDATNLAYALLTIDSADARVQIFANNGTTLQTGPLDEVTAPPGEDITLKLCFGDTGTGSSYLTAHVNGVAVSQLRLPGWTNSPAYAPGAICGDITGSPKWQEIALEDTDSEDCACHVCSTERSYKWTMDAQQSFWDTSPAALTGGRFRSTSTPGVIGSAGKRCFQASILSPGCTVSIKAKVYWASNSTLGAGIGLINSGWCYFVARPNFGNFGISTTSGGLPAITSFGSGPVSGQELELQIQDTGGDATVRCYRDGTLLRTDTAAPIDLLSGSLFYPAMILHNVSPLVVEWDDFEVTVTA